MKHLFLRITIPALALILAAAISLLSGLLRRTEPAAIDQFIAWTGLTSSDVVHLPQPVWVDSNLANGQVLAPLYTPTLAPPKPKQSPMARDFKIAARG